MPKFREIQVSGGDRDSLLRYAVVARLTRERPEGPSRRRGAPRIPDALAEAGRNQAWFTNRLFGGGLAAVDAEEIVIAVEKAAKSDDGVERTLQEPPLSALWRSFIAASAPEKAAEGVDGRYWRVLRRLPISRHVVDVLMAASAGANHLREHPATARDLLAVARVQRGLCLVALGGYPFSARAVDLIAVLSRWDVATPLSYVRSMPTGRRLARALDRALLTYAVDARPGTPQSDLFHAVAGLVASGPRTTAGSNGVPSRTRLIATPLKGPHTAASSSASMLRLARRIAIHDVDDSYRPTVLEAFQHTCQGDDGTRDQVIRREAFWYLIEMAPALAALADGQRLRSLDSVVSRLTGKHRMPFFADIWDTLEAVGVAVDSPTVSDNGGTAPGYIDLVCDVRINGRTWKLANAPYGAALERHLPLSARPPHAAWRELTMQVALPTRDLLRELLVMPSSARVGTIADTLRAAGPAVLKTATRALEAMLADEDVLGNAVIAKRAAWSIGALGSPTTATLRVLVDVVKRVDVNSGIRADAAWAVGDVIAAAPTAPGRDGANECLLDVLDRLARDLGAGHPVRPDHVVVGHAAAHSLAIQRNPVFGDRLGKLAGAFRCTTGQEPVTAAAVNRLYGLTDWAMRLLDNTTVLSDANW